MTLQTSPTLAFSPRRTGSPELLAQTGPSRRLWSAEAFPSLASLASHRQVGLNVSVPGRPLQDRLSVQARPSAMPWPVDDAADTDRVLDRRASHARQVGGLLPGDPPPRVAHPVILHREQHLSESPRAFLRWAKRTSRSLSRPVGLGAVACSKGRVPIDVRLCGSAEMSVPETLGSATLTRLGSAYVRHRRTGTLDPRCPRGGSGLVAHASPGALIRPADDRTFVPKACEGGAHDVH